MNDIRPHILRMQPYLSGEQPPPGKFIKLNTNENPYPPSPKIGGAIEVALRRGLNRYPDLTGEPFRLRAAELLGVEPDWILCGNGSDDILTICTRAYVGEGQLLRLPFPSYTFYATLAEVQGARFETCRFRDDWTLGPEFAAPHSDLRLAFLPNPNSPSGTRISDTALAELVERMPCPLLIDEAYVDFTHGDALALVRRSPRVLVSRTLSKSYSLAGLRFGFLIAQPETIAQLRKVKDPANCDAISIAVATAAIDDVAWMRANRDKILATRRRMADRLAELGFQVPKSEANFLWCTHPRQPARTLFERLKAEQVLVRYLDFPGWGDGIRITIGTDEQCDLVLDLLDRFLQE